MRTYIAGFALLAGLAGAADGLNAQFTDKTKIPAVLTDVTFLTPQGTTDAGRRSLHTYATTLNPSLYTNRKVYKVPVGQQLNLSFNTSNGYFAAPIVISSNPGLVQVLESGKDETAAVKNRAGQVAKYVRLNAVPTAATEVEIKVIWGTATRRVFWTISPAGDPPAQAPPPPPAPVAPTQAPVLGGPTVWNTNLCPHPPNTPLSWSAVPGASAYAVEFRNLTANRTTTYTTSSTSTTGPAPLIAGNNYDWRVQGKNAGGSGPWSARRGLRAEEGPGPAPGTTCTVGVFRPRF